MPRKGNKFVGATLPEEWEVTFNELCQKTGETKVTFMKRIIENELAIIEGREEDIRYAVDTIVQKKLDIIISKIDKSNIEFYNLKNEFTGIRGALLYLIKVTLRSIYSLIGHMHITTTMNENKYKEFRATAEKKSQQEFDNCVSVIDSNDMEIINKILLNNKKD